MNFAVILKLTGNVLLYEALFMCIPVIVALIYGDGDFFAFIFSMLITVTVSLPLSLIKPKEKKIHPKEGFTIAALTWILLSAFGALPFYFSGFFNSITDCFFESVSGFTTTGATILTNIEALPHGILFWRSFTQWIGGMGILVFMIAIMPNITASTVNLLKAESPGPTPSKIVPKIKKTAMIMYIIYLSMTIVQIILLLISGMSFYDSIVHTFSTAGTGGFSIKNASIGAYNNLSAEIIITIFAFMFGVNFTLYFYLIKRNFKNFFTDEELRFYFIIVCVAIIFTALNITPLYDNIGDALRQSSFQVVTIITSTGYSTADYSVWPSLSQAIIMLLMLTGCCAGSTGGGIKLIRILVLFKAIKCELKKLLHPNVISTVKLSGKRLDADIINKVLLFTVIYGILVVFGSLLVSLENKDLLTTVTAVISATSNIGPGFSEIGPSSSYAGFSVCSKIVLSFCMLAGRLEFFPLMVLLSPAIWRKNIA